MEIIYKILANLLFGIVLIYLVYLGSYFIVKWLYSDQAAKDYKKWAEKQMWKATTATAKALGRGLKKLAEWLSRKLEALFRRHPLPMGIIALATIVALAVLLF